MAPSSKVSRGEGAMDYFKGDFIGPHFDPEGRAWLCKWRTIMSLPPVDPPPFTRDPLLVEREKTHGSFEHTAAIAASIKTVFDSHGYRGKLNMRQQEVVDLIATKLGRIIAGDNLCKEHYLDIAGYAKLGSEACE